MTRGLRSRIEAVEREADDTQSEVDRINKRIAYHKAETIKYLRRIAVLAPIAGILWVLAWLMERW